MTKRCDAAIHFHDLPIRIDDEGFAQDTFAAKLLFTPRTVCVNYLTLWVTEKRKIQVVFCFELFMRIWFVLRNTDHFRTEIR